MRPGKCQDRIDRIKGIEKEYRVAVVARDVLGEALKKAPSTLRANGLEQANLDGFRDNLEATYVIRIFAEFETGLRDYWKHLPKKRSVARVSDMIRSVGSKRKIRSRELDDVDKVRKFRNRLVHEEDSESQVVGVGDARKFLCIFFSRLPEDW